MTTIKKALLFSVINQHALQIINFISIAILARLLAPEEVGVFAVATSIAFLAIEIRSFGVGEYLIRESEIDRSKIRGVLGVMAIMSWGMGLLLAVAAPWIADFYGVPDLRDILWIITVPFIVAPYSSVPYALMMREMNFSAVFKVDFAGALARNVCSISLVLMGYGYYGLAWGTFAGVLVEFLAIVFYRPASSEWIPRFRGLGHLFRVGVQISLGKFLNSTSQNASDLLLGRLASMKDVGLFSRGLGLVLYIQNLLINAVSPVALPHLAEVRRSGGSVPGAYLNAIALVGAFALPFFAVANLAAPSMIVALFGDQWGESIKIASILALWAMIQSVHCFSSQALLAASHERLVLIKEIISFVVKIALIVYFIPMGLEFVAWGFVIGGCVDFVVASLMISRVYGIGGMQLLRAYMPNIVAALACWSALKLVGMQIDFTAMNAWLALLVTGLLMVPVWLLALKLGKNLAWPYVIGIIRRVIPV